ncbi:hypothetical protein Poly51_49010 [Rubripirellula tenax]|uniref:Uncharacterized protein n=1 Tax=Rubripirellula tenax TaxID=2528015 RepID=A0A5C6ELJ9_9BACT|nr:hypothetical protein Poly51_49010 [Rubripirellula tenax]
MCDPGRPASWQALQRVRRCETRHGQDGLRTGHSSSAPGYRAFVVEAGRQRTSPDNGGDQRAGSVSCPFVKPCKPGSVASHGSLQFITSRSAVGTGCPNRQHLAWLSMKGQQPSSLPVSANASVCETQTRPGQTSRERRKTARDSLDTPISRSAPQSRAKVRRAHRVGRSRWERASRENEYWHSRDRCSGMSLSTRRRRWQSGQLGTANATKSEYGSRLLRA